MGALVGARCRIGTVKALLCQGGRTEAAQAIWIMTRENWQWIERALGGAALFSLLAFWLLEFWFFKTLPKSSDPALGAIHPVNWHGTTVYITTIQQLETDVLFWGSAVLFAVALVVDLWVKPFRN